MYVCTRTFVSDNVLRVMERVCVCGGGGGGGEEAAHHVNCRVKGELMMICLALRCFNPFTSVLLIERM